MIRVLHIVGKMSMGGQETFIMNLYRNIDRNKVQFDFVVHATERQYYDDEIEKLGGTIYRITPMGKGLWKHMKELYQILKDNRDYIVHRHTCSSIVAIDLLVAKIAKIKKIIVHSHATQTSSHEKLNWFFKPFMNRLTKQRLACSQAAGEFLYGKKATFQVVNNAITLEEFKFDETMRNEIREQYQANDKFILGHVGRFDKAKNHVFLVELLEEIIKEKENAELWLIGDGNLKNEIQILAQEKQIQDKIKFMGIQKNVNQYMMGMDCFLFPSIYEGLGIVLIEAQCAGLNCVISNHIPQEAIITQNVKVLDLQTSKEEWIHAILSNPRKERDINFEEEKIKNYGIEGLVQRMNKIYEVER